MSKVVAIESITLDGVMQGPGRPDEDRRGNFTDGGWALPYADADRLVRVYARWLDGSMERGPMSAGTVVDLASQQRSFERFAAFIENVLYDGIGGAYAGTRRSDPRIARVIRAALGDATSVVNIGAGSGSYEPTDLEVVPIEPSELMIRQRRNSLFYASTHSAYVASILTSIIATCAQAGINALVYLVALQEHRSEVFRNPSAWLPWNYTEQLVPV